jgi:hypothetical protein
VHNTPPRIEAYISTPLKLIIKLIMTKNGKREGKTDLINKFSPCKAEVKEILGLIIIDKISKVEIKVIIIFKFIVTPTFLKKIKNKVNINNSKKQKR